MFLMSISSAKAQTYNGMGSRWYGGGTFGLSFGSVTSISIMPEVAYAVTDDLLIGGGLRYSYYRDTYYTPAYESTIWGGKLFARYYLFSNFFAHIEAERLYFEDPYYSSPTGDQWIYRDYFYGGFGYRQWMGSNSYMSFALLFDLTSSDYTFGSNPFFRIGFGVGF